MIDQSASFRNSEEKADAEYQREFDRKMNRIKEWGLSVDENELKRIVAFQLRDIRSGPPKRYTADFAVSFTRKRPDIVRSLRLLHSKEDGADQSKTKKNNTVFEVDTPFTVALLGRSPALFRFVAKSKDILNEFVSKQHVFSMLSLLDFSCKFQSDAADRAFDIDYKLNVQLHRYQVQSLRWMVDEERDPIGFYRHFYEKGLLSVSLTISKGAVMTPNAVMVLVSE